MSDRRAGAERPGNDRRAGAERPGNDERKRAWARWRDKLRDRPTADFAYRAGVGVVGLAVLGLGILAIPYPGPGWAIVFVGLAILATEFEWAHRVLRFVRKRYDAFMAWFKRQGWGFQALGVLFTTAVVLASLWTFGALNLAANLVGLEWPWLQSPIA